MNRRAEQLGLRDAFRQRLQPRRRREPLPPAPAISRCSPNRAATRRWPRSPAAPRWTSPLSTARGATGWKNKNALIGPSPRCRRPQDRRRYTPKAGKCLIAYARRGQTGVLLVMLGAPNRWWDATDILDGVRAWEYGATAPNPGRSP